MKSAQRHKLETNVLAVRLESYIERTKPYASKILGVLIALVAVILIWSYISKASADRRSEAWDLYNDAVLSASFGEPSNLEKIHRAAQDYPGTRMQQMADVTWADAQVCDASQIYFVRRQTAMDALNRAASIYQAIIQSSKDDQLINRSRLGMARIYEMQNHLDKARDQYRQVTGTYANYAQQQVVRLGKAGVNETYSWLSTAQIPRTKAPVAPGMPGKSPEFSAGDIALPKGAASNPTKPQEKKAAADAFNELLKSIGDESNKSTPPDQKKANQAPVNGAATPAAPPTKTPSASETKGAASSTAPADSTKAENKPAVKAPPAPASEKSAK
ncbi:MAG TPA: hypothetical protein VFW73_12145 [Lacipirellulaceae bacterium]|nr:hypothetical protein [Lacipirellulaceae bacterium]